MFGGKDKLSIAFREMHAADLATYGYVKSRYFGKVFVGVDVGYRIFMANAKLGRM